MEKKRYLKLGKIYKSAYTITERGGGLGASTIFKKFNETYAPS